MDGSSIIVKVLAAFALAFGLQPESAQAARTVRSTITQQQPQNPRTITPQQPRNPRSEVKRPPIELRPDPQQPNPPPKPEPPPATQCHQPIESIKQLSEMGEALGGRDRLNDRMNKPQFFINATTFTFFEGSRPELGDDFVGAAQHPILIPLARLLQLQDLYRFLSEQPDNDMTFWQPYFAKANLAIEHKSLVEISSGTLSCEELTRKLYDYDAGISKLFELAARAFAEKRNLTYRKATIIVPMSHKVEVSFQKNPNNGHLFVIPSTLYAPDGSLDYMWREILDEKPRLGGSYYYKVIWPDGSITPPTRFLVERAGQVFTINQ